MTPTGSTALAMRIAELEAENAILRNGHAEIVSLSAGWDEHGSTGPRSQLSWESVGRLAMDISLAAMGPNVEGKGLADNGQHEGDKA
ncbi:MAG: hypothetical protein ACYC3A_05840 [Halothiobacillus sp.]